MDGIIHDSTKIINCNELPVRVSYTPRLNKCLYYSIFISLHVINLRYF